MTTRRKQPESVQAADADRQLVVFSLLGEDYGVPVASVREIIRYTPPSATAAENGMVKGVISVRGVVLPVVDLSIHLGRPLELDGDSRIVVIELAKGPVGLIVNTVKGVQVVAAGEISPLPGALTGNPLGDQVAALDDRLIMLLDAERALGPALVRRAARRRRTPPAASTESP